MREFEFPALAGDTLTVSVNDNFDLVFSCRSGYATRSVLLLHPAVARKLGKALVGITDKITSIEE